MKLKDFKTLQLKNVLPSSQPNVGVSGFFGVSEQSNLIMADQEVAHVCGQGVFEAVEHSLKITWIKNKQIT